MKKRKSFTGASNKPSRLQMSARFTTIRMSTKWHVLNDMYTVWLARIHPQSALSHVLGPSIKTKQNRLPLQSFLRRTVAGCYTTSVVKNGATKSMWQHWACVVNIFHIAFLLAFSENFVLRGDVACIPAAKWLILDLTGYARMASSGDLKRVFTDQGPYFQSTFHAFEGRLLVMGHIWGIRSLANAMTPGKEGGALQGCRQDVSQKSCDVQNKVALNS